MDKMNGRFLTAAVLSVSLAAAAGGTAYAGQWEQAEGIWRYREDNGSYITGDWKEVEGKWYYFDENSAMVTGTSQIDGKDEHFGEDGAWAGETAAENAGVEDSESGEAAQPAEENTGEGNSENSEVPSSGGDDSGSGAAGPGYADPQAAPQRQYTHIEIGPGAPRWIQDEKGWWYSDPRGGYPAEEWVDIEGVWYYFDAEGYMLSDAWVTTDGKRYRVGEDGAMLTGPAQIQVDGISYELAEDGSVTEPPKTEEDLQAEAIAAGILASITNDSMTKVQKAQAIYRYVKGSMTYSHINTYPTNYTEGAAALYGFRRHSGNCYIYYSMSHYLLDLAGMPNIRVVRASDGNHFWNLVNVDGLWYHFDTTPRRLGGDWCLVTTNYLMSHSWSSHNYDVAAYPATP